ncbi:hypothetical protein SH504_003413 [Escherichia coli]|nr:hypothetical protein [Escherichia coli]EGZ4165691.1 hypothetical protein [Escherichia coli]EHI0421724.1 hypothetical protein [Escherichia coli]EHL0101454.1 hypothetical protein [Escherichia coli]EHX0307933.1 hypothetical protein [Escherichia coli]
MKSEGLTPAQLAERNAEYVTEISRLEKACAALAAENEALKSNLIYWGGEDSEPVRSPLDYAHEAGLESGEEFEMQVAARMPNLTYRVVSSSRFKTEIELIGGLLPETPATDAFLAEVKTEARKEGAYFVANRMLAAWEAGFIDDTAKNAADIARMILTSTEFMANAPEGDFDRSFSDGVLEDIAEQLGKGGKQ